MSAHEQADIFGDSVPLDELELRGHSAAIAAAERELGHSLTADEAGALIHERRGKHPRDVRCNWCCEDGTMALIQLNTRRRDLTQEAAPGSGTTSTQSEAPPAGNEGVPGAATPPTSRCASRAPKTSLPAGMTVDAAQGHPHWKYALEPTAQCDLDTGHQEIHHNGLLTWWDPPRVSVAGAHRPAPTDTPAVADGWTCPDCQHANPAGATYCRSCATCRALAREPHVPRPPVPFNEFPEGY